jgi:hypothetical protein
MMGSAGAPATGGVRSRKADSAAAHCRASAALMGRPAEPERQPSRRGPPSRTCRAPGVQPERGRRCMDARADLTAACLVLTLAISTARGMPTRTLAHRAEAARPHARDVRRELRHDRRPGHGRRHCRRGLRRRAGRRWFPGWVIAAASLQRKAGRRRARVAAPVRIAPHSIVGCQRLADMAVGCVHWPRAGPVRPFPGGLAIARAARSRDNLGRSDHLPIIVTIERGKTSPDQGTMAARSSTTFQLMNSQNALR